MLEQPEPQRPSRTISVFRDPPEFDSVAEDAELLAVFLETGDREPLELLIHRHAPMVAGVCRATVADAGAAEDAFQATFLVLLKSAKRIRNHASLGAWLHGVAYRTACRARWKWRESLKRTSSIVDVENTLVEEADTLSKIARQMELEVLDQELQNLPQSLRDPLVEHYLLGYSAVQIAERMELTQAAVEGRIRRGKRRLRGQLARRGVGLSVAVASATWFQQQLAASDATSWIDRFVGEEFVRWNSSSEKVSDLDPDISSLVQQEFAMSTMSAVKIALSSAIVTYLGAALVLSSQGTSDTTSQSNSPVTIESLHEEPVPSFLAQAAKTPGNSAAQPNQPNPFNPTVPLSNQPSNSPLPQAGATQQPPNAQMKSGIGMGGMPRAGSPQVQMPTSGKVEPWEETDGPKPTWLTEGTNDMDRVEEYRKNLVKSIDLDFNGMPLNTVLKALSGDLKVQFWIDQVELDTLGVAVDSPITMQMSGLTLRQALKLILEPLELTYVVHENWITITSKDSADSKPNIAYYELSHILPNSAQVDSLMVAIEMQIEPDSWLSGGGTSSLMIVGSLLIVSAPETTQEQIAALLGRIAKTSRKNLSTTKPFDNRFYPVAPVPGTPTQGPGGMGGGMF